MKLNFLTFILVSSLFFVGNHAVAATPNIVAPDFAYPETVIDNSESQIVSSLKAGDDITALRALINYSLAQTSIGSENWQTTVRKIKETSNSFHSAESRALANILLATVYQTIYQSNKYVFDNRNLPPFPLPDDINEWSGQQFRSVISQLCDQSLTNPLVLQSKYLSDYETIVDVNKESLIYFPTLYDFIAYRTIDIRKQITPFSGGCVGILSLAPRMLFMVNPGFVPSSNQIQKILETYGALLSFHSKRNGGDVAPEIYCDIQRLNFVADNLYNNLTEEGNKLHTERLISLYDDFKSSEFSGNVLIALNGLTTDGPEKKTYYGMLHDNIARYPDFALVNCLKNIKQNLENVHCETSSPSHVAPGVPFEVNVSNTNSPKLVVDIYNVGAYVKQGTDWVDYSVLASLKPIASKTIDFTHYKVPFAADTTIMLTIPDYGYYAVVQRDAISKNRRNTFQLTHSTELAPAITGSITNPELYVVNPLTGEPVDKADINFRKDRTGRESRSIKVGSTDRNGFFSLKSAENGTFQPTKGKDVAASSVGYWKQTPPKDQWNYSSNSYTDLAIYRPGDTVRWCAVVYQTKPLENRISSGVDVQTILYNANNLPVDTAAMTTDDWGRVNGSFIVPKGELTGNYRINFKSTDGKFIGSRSFMVSDYKLPTYQIILDKPATGVPEAGDVTLSGIAKTYSGVPVSNASVQAVISVSIGRWWFRSNEVQFTTLSDTTDATGRFKMTLPKRFIVNSPAPQGLFTANVSVTSLAGESQQAKVNFTSSARYAILSTLPDNFEVSQPINLSKYLKVVTSDDQTLDTPLMYTLCPVNDTVPTLTGAVSTDVNWSKLRGAAYKLEVKATAVEAEPLLISNLILYRNNDDYSPVKEIIWYPGNNNLTISGNKTILNIFAANDDTHLLCYIASDIVSPEHHWLKLHKGANSIEVKMPSGSKSAQLSLVAIKNYKSENLEIKLTSEESLRSLNFTTETFRDRLIPGETETWTFRTLDKSGRPDTSAVILDMYNKALDALIPAGWSIGFSKGYWQASRAYSPQFGNVWTNYQPSVAKNYVCNDITIPSLQTYGMTFSPIRRYRTMLLNATSVKVVNEHKEMANAAMDAVAPVMYKSEETAGAAVDDLGSVSEHNDGVSVDENTKKDNDEFSYRDANTTLAFFAPTLTTDSEGRLSYSFRVPNANTTWSFNALAYDRQLSSASIVREVLANKPIMVQPNLPRYLRAGDTATILSTVTNNSDSTCYVTAVTELFNPLSSTIQGSVITDTLLLKPNESRTVKYNINVDGNSPFIGFRIKAKTDKFSDGEQALIPVLESTTPVIETTPFYISPDSTSFSLQIPRYGNDAKVTLQYCDNPTWYVVTALPGISKQQARTAPEAAAAIFSAAIADGLLKTYPQIEAALKEWSSGNQSDSTLVSMLQRNADLKTFLLHATPWMLDAQSDTERMQRLALLFDRNNINDVYSSNISLLKKLQRANGGWAWINQYEKPSEWATQQALTIIGRLNQLQFLPKDKFLNQMIDKALLFVQAENEKTFMKYPKSDFTDYVMLLDCWPSFKTSVTTNKIVSQTVQNYVSKWKKMDLISKINAVSLFYHHGYKPLAQQVLQSLSQFAKTSPTQGMYWPLLDDLAGASITQLSLASRALEAYHLVNPQGKEVNAIRQWLILQKEARNWGDGIQASNVAASILLTSPKWISAAKPAQIMIGDKTVTPTQVERNLGYFRTDISSMLPSGKILRVNKTDLTPAWGAIYSQSTEIMQDVKPSSCDAVSIEKRLYIQKGESFENVSQFKVGDKVRVELLLKVNRDMDYVAINDDRPACFEPVEQLPQPIFAEGLCFYRENRDASTNIFISRLPKGTYLLTYDMWVNNSGTYSSGIATVQSQYAPQLTAHSAGSIIRTAP